jgi:hypothetical protein
MDNRKLTTDFTPSDESLIKLDGERMPIEDVISQLKQRDALSRLLEDMLFHLEDVPQATANREGAQQHFDRIMNEGWTLDNIEE